MFEMKKFKYKLWLCGPHSIKIQHNGTSGNAGLSTFVDHVMHVYFIKRVSPTYFRVAGAQGSMWGVQRDRGKNGVENDQPSICGMWGMWGMWVNHTLALLSSIGQSDQLAWRKIDKRMLFILASDHVLGEANQSERLEYFSGFCSNLGITVNPMYALLYGSCCDSISILLIPFQWPGSISFSTSKIYVILIIPNILSKEKRLSSYIEADDDDLKCTRNWNFTFVWKNIPNQRKRLKTSGLESMAPFCWTDTLQSVQLMGKCGKLRIQVASSVQSKLTTSKLFYGRNCHGHTSNNKYLVALVVNRLHSILLHLRTVQRPANMSSDNVKITSKWFQSERFKPANELASPSTRWTPVSSFLLNWISQLSFGQSVSCDGN